MRSWRVIVPMVVGALVGGVVMAWPVQPLWVVKTETWPEFVGLADDDRTIITQHFEKQLVYCRWDVRTGELLGKHLLEAKQDPNRSVSVALMGDQRTLRVSSRSQWRSFRSESNDVSWYLVDSQNNRKIESWPIHRVWGLVDVGTDIWVWYGVGGAGPFSASDLIRIASLTTKQDICRFEMNQMRNPKQLILSPDNKHAALVWHHMEWERWFDSLTVHELPSGKEVNSVAMPEGLEDVLLTQWDSTGIYITGYLREEAPPNRQRTMVKHRIDPTGPKPQVLPLPDDLQDYRRSERVMKVWQHRPEFAAFLGGWGSEPSWWDDVWYTCADWVYRQMKWTINRPRWDCGQFELLDRTSGRFRLSLPSRVYRPHAITRDGNYLVTGVPQRNGGLMVWDLNPTPRVYFTVPAGLLTFVALNLFSRWRHRRHGTAPRLEIPAARA